MKSIIGSLMSVVVLLSGCAMGGRVATGAKYVAVAPQGVEILFQAPNWPCQQIGIVTSQGAQLASDATTYSELQSQAAKLGADAVVIISSGMRAYASAPGFAISNASAFGNGYVNQFGGQFSFGAQANGFAMGPRTFVGLNLQGIALKRVSVQPVRK